MDTMFSSDDLYFDVEFLNCIVDKKKDFVVIDADSHFCEFVGVHYSKVKQGKLSLLDLLIPQSRQEIVEKLCKKDSPFVYLDLFIKDHNSKYNYVHCTVRNNKDSSLCSITFADVSKVAEKSKKIRESAKTMNHLIDLITGGICLFKVEKDMHFRVLYANEACCQFFGTAKQDIKKREYRIDDFVHHEDKSRAFQAIGTAMATKKPIDMEIRILTHKDEFIWCKMNSDIQRYDKDGCPIFHAMFTDITEIKAAQRDADTQREKLLKILKNVPAPVFCASYENPLELVIVSTEFAQAVGFKRKDILEKLSGDMSKLIVESDLELVKDAFVEMDDEKPREVCYTIKFEDKEPVKVCDRRKAITLENGERYIIGILEKE